jgi:uncharacterized membrane protein
MSSAYLWAKGLHVVCVASRFAGWFHLPRFFVNLATVTHERHAERERLLLMARRLYHFSNRRSERWCRVSNEASVGLFASIVVLAVVKPI